MHYLTKLFILTVISLLANHSRANAQGNQPKPRKIEFKTVCPKIVDGQYKFYTPSIPIPDDKTKFTGKWIEVELNRYSVLGPFEVKALNSIHLFKSPDIDTKPAITLKVAPGSSSILVLFYPVGDKKYATKSIDAKSVPWRSYYITNFSKYPISIKLGKNPEVIVKKGKSVSLKASTEGSEVAIIKAKYEDDVKYVRETKWRLNAKQREYITIYIPEGKKRLSWLHTVEDKPEKKKD